MFAWLKKTGMKAGQFDYEFRKIGLIKMKCVNNFFEPDINIKEIPPIFKHCSSLWIEFKCGKNKLTKEQEEFKELMEQQGRKCIVARSADEALDEIEKYLAE